MRVNTKTAQYQAWPAALCSQSLLMKETQGVTHDGRVRKVKRDFGKL